MTTKIAHELRRVQSRRDWDAYHAIRRSALFEARGRDDYDPAHPDEHHPAHHPFLLWAGGTPVGTVRIDLPPGDMATLRLIAVAAASRRQGHGRALLELAAAFARAQGAVKVSVISAPDAVGFYERCGFSARGGGCNPGTGERRLGKRL